MHRWFSLTVLIISNLTSKERYTNISQTQSVEFNNQITSIYKYNQKYFNKILFKWQQWSFQAFIIQIIDN